MYDRIKDLLIGESNKIPTQRAGESDEAFKARRAAWLATAQKKGHAEMQNPSRESGSKENIKKAIKGR
jgi:hypothetical protein